MIQQETAVKPIPTIDHMINDAITEHPLANETEIIIPDYSGDVKPKHTSPEAGESYSYDVAESMR